MDVIFGKENNIHKKIDKEYFVLANLNYNTLYIFERDVELVWDLIDGEMTIQTLFDKLKEENYPIVAEELYNLVSMLSRLGLINSSIDKADFAYITENNALESYIDRCSENGMPSILHVELTNRCNLECIHCFHDEDLKSLNYDDLEKLFASIENTSFVRVTLTGGEVCMYPQWKRVITVARRHGLMVAVLSNVTLLTESDIDFLKESNICFIRTSMYGATAETHDSITKVNGSFQKTIDNILALKHSGILVTVSCTLMNQNVHEALELSILMGSLGVNVAFDYRIIPSRRDIKKVENLMINGAQFDLLLAQGILKRPKKIKCNPGCYRIAVAHNGEIYPCDSLRVSIGNIRKDNVLGVLSGENMRKLRERIRNYNPEDCKVCQYEKFCTRCPGFVWNNKSCPNVHHKIQCLYCQIACPLS